MIGSSTRRSLAAASSRASVSGCSSLQAARCRHFAIFPLEMPQLSPSFKSGKVVSWKVQAGAEVDMLDILFDIQTSTLTEKGLLADGLQHVMEVESHEEGVLTHVFVKEGDTVFPGQVIQKQAGKIGKSTAAQQARQHKAQNAAAVRQRLYTGNWKRAPLTHVSAFPPSFLTVPDARAVCGG